MALDLGYIKQRMAQLKQQIQKFVTDIPADTAYISSKMNKNVLPSTPVAAPKVNIPVDIKPEPVQTVSAQFKEQPLFNPLISSSLGTPPPKSTPTPTPTPTPVENTGNDWVDPKMPTELSTIIDEVFGDRSLRAKQLLSWRDEQGNVGGENLPFDPKPKDNVNDDGSIDRGLFQINSNTFEDYWNRQGNKRGTYPFRKKMQSLGIESYDDMFDPRKNTEMAKIIYSVQGWKAWAGRPDWMSMLDKSLFVT